MANNPSAFLPPISSKVALYVTDSVTGQPIENAIIHILWEDGDTDDYLSSKEPLELEVDASKNASMLVTVNADGYPEIKQMVSLPEPGSDMTYSLLMHPNDSGN